MLVVTVLSAVAWMSLGVVSNNADQVRFEDTRNRLQAIRRAIIGDTSRTINGQPEVRGYVADMGRLPNNLNELVSIGGQTPYAYDSDTKLWSGWNGPYLPPGYGSTGRYLDGWGNNDGSSDFGWTYSLNTPNAGDLTVQSFGRDGVSGGAQPYDADYPNASAVPIVDESEYRIAINAITVVFDFKNSPNYWDCTVSASNENSCSAGGGEWYPVLGHCSLSVYTREGDCVANGGTWTVEDVTTEPQCINATWLPVTSVCMAIAYHNSGIFYKDATHSPNITSSHQSVTWDGTRRPVTFSFASGAYLHLGQAAFAIVKADSSNACPVTQFDDAYSFPSGAPLWTPFTYVPGTTLSFERKITQ